MSRNVSTYIQYSIPPKIYFSKGTYAIFAAFRKILVQNGQNIFFCNPTHLIRWEIDMTIIGESFGKFDRLVFAGTSRKVEVKSLENKRLNLLICNFKNCRTCTCTFHDKIKHICVFTTKKKLNQDSGFCIFKKIIYSSDFFGL